MLFVARAGWLANKMGVGGQSDKCWKEQKVGELGTNEATDSPEYPSMPISLQTRLLRGDTRNKQTLAGTQRLTSSGRGSWEAREPLD